MEENLEMKNIKKYIKLMVTSHSGISSKRVCGVLGFLVVIFIIIFCTVNGIQAPDMIDTFVYAICMLLGIDSITSIWKNK
jgi:hypothetical protein